MHCAQVSGTLAYCHVNGYVYIVDHLVTGFYSLLFYLFTDTYHFLKTYKMYFNLLVPLMSDRTVFVAFYYSSKYAMISFCAKVSFQVSNDFLRDRPQEALLG